MENYDNYASTFSNSRKNMKWEEIDYFLKFLNIKSINNNILDVGCGNGRLIKQLEKSDLKIDSYLGIDNSLELLKEAKKLNPGYKFVNLNMLNLNLLDYKPNCIFFIASFHHLQNIEERLLVLNQAYNLLENDGYIFMTNWSLNSNLNYDKYKNSIILGSRNNFGAIDYNIKIGEFSRYYHCFSLDELDYLFKKSFFKIVENKLFENQRNYISILKKIKT